MKRSKKNQKYLKVNIGYDEKFFDKTLFLKKNNEFKDNENRNNNLDDEKNKQEIKKDNLNKTKINYNYDDLIKNTLLQYLQYYNNNNFDKIEKEQRNNEYEDEEKEMKIEDDITKDFKNKIYKKLNIINNDKEKDENGNASKEMIKEQSDLLFFGEKSFINFSKKNSGFMSELFSKINENLNKNKNKKSDYN